MLLKRERQEFSAIKTAIDEEKQRKKEDLKKRQKFNKIRREENAKKAEVVQVVSASCFLCL